LPVSTSCDSVVAGSTVMAKTILVTLETRTLEAFDGASRVFAFSCLVGREGHHTTPGRYRITRKARDHHSRRYDAPMRFAMFFSADGKAIHESENFGLRNLGMSFGCDSCGSHGCVGLSHDDAQALFDWTPRRTAVIVREHLSDPQSLPSEPSRGGAARP
jgi:lipoprotein-anchoring transpeptidase ErfK/SrfK